MGRYIAPALAVLALAACGSETLGDTKTPSVVVDGAWSVQKAPDLFPNIATACSAFVDGWRIWATTREAPPVLVRDESCKAAGQ